MRFVTVFAAAYPYKPSDISPLSAVSKVQPEYSEAVQATVQTNFEMKRLWRFGNLSCQTAEGGTRPSEAQATITLAFEVDKHGAPRGLQGEKSSDASRDAELIAAVEEWRVAVPRTANFDVGTAGK